MAISTVVLAQGDSMRILSNSAVVALSVQAPTSSSFTVLGDAPFNAYLKPNGSSVYTYQQIAIDSMTLTNGEGFTVTAYNVTNPIDNLTIRAVSGVINVLIQT
jgi:hypothetical protein